MYVWVYKYRFWDPDRNELATSASFFTIEAIRAGLGMPVIESGIKVEIGELDDYGRLKRTVIH